MTDLDLYLASLSIEERNETLDEWEAEERAEARADDRDGWRLGQAQYERYVLGW